jgi:hypothetical protein
VRQAEKIAIAVLALLTTGVVAAGQSCEPAARKKILVATKQVEMKVSSALAAAQEAYSAGRFSEAEELQKKLSDGDKYSLPGLLLRARLNLSAWRLKEATQDLVQARRISPTDKQAALLLAEAYLRQDRFHDAGAAYEAAFEDQKAAQAESFATQEPYKIEGLGNAVRIRLLQVDPVPIVAVRINGGEVLNFLVDTNTSQTVIDAGLASKMKLTTFGAEQTSGAGSQKYPIEYARISTLALGVWILHDIPVILKSTTGHSTAALTTGAKGYSIGGVIGTELLYHFISTLDFAGGELVLRRKIPAVIGPLRNQLTTERAAVVPIRVVGDHYILADGTVNGVGPLPFLIGTASTGGAFTAPASTLKMAKLVPGTAADAIAACDPENVSDPAAGDSASKVSTSASTPAAPAITTLPFPIGTLTLGPVTRHNLTGVAGIFPAGLETSAGVRIGGLISNAFFKPDAITFDFDAATLWVAGSGQ